MENKEPAVEFVSEPKIESRFGFSRGGKTLSSKAIKVCAISTAAALSTIFLMKSPQKIYDEPSRIKPPEDVHASLSQIEMQSYSAIRENEQMKSKNKKVKKRVIVRLPGLQEIDRHNIDKIPPGSLAKAVLVTGASNGPVRAQLSETLRIQGEALIPAGTTLLGVGQSTEDRLLIHFSKVVFKNGSFEEISAQAADSSDKTVGLKGSRIGRAAMKYAAAIGLNFVGGMAEGLQDRDIVGQQVVTRPSAKNALLNGTSRATLDLANETITDLRNKAPIIQVKAGTKIYIIFDGEQ
jgi:type IV secretory pathway VirB10-like protein